MIEAKNVVYEYSEKMEQDDKFGSCFRAVDDVSFNIESGDFVAILGHNGSGKSTIAKMINGLLLPTEGVIYVDGKRTDVEETLIDIRKSCGMVFQNPDNQLIGSVVEEDVAFGPENLQIPPEEIKELVDISLDKVDMLKFKDFSPNKLSGGQKQRVAIAGILAMKPKCIILDEPTAMLDPRGRKEVIDTIYKLNREEGVTIILITHYMSEVLGADRLIIMNNGEVALDGKPKELFKDIEGIRALGLGFPIVTELSIELIKEGYDIDIIFSEEEFVEQVLKLRQK